jgi:hypothetical protein
MTRQALKRRLDALEAELGTLEEANVDRWWRLCESLHVAILAQLTIDELLDLEGATERGEVPPWWTDRFAAFVASDPAHGETWQEAERLERELLASGYRLTLDERGVVVAPGMVKP